MMTSYCKRGLTISNCARFLLGTFLLLGLNYSCAACRSRRVDNIDMRLARSIVPESYTIKLIPFIWDDNFTFNGEVEILVNVTENTDRVILHALDLKIDNSATTIKEISHAEEEIKNFTIESQTMDEIKQFHIIYTSEQLQAGKQYVTYLKFIGVLNAHLFGFYRSSYNVGDDIRWIASTQFQPTDARSAFPSFDEPSFKAKFQISLARSTNMTSLSNMPKKDESEPVQEVPGYVWDHYESTVPMSTYLVAFIISDFEVLHSSTNNFSIWGRKDVIHELQYPLNIGLTILNYFEDYFQIKYPLPKLDMVALPSFSGDAMENWGLITFHEPKIRFQEGTSVGNSKQNIAILVAHELAHQWFGNLVTPSWWTDLWLNEGFATFFSYVAMDAIEPKWKVVEQFVINEMQYVFTSDALSSSHPIITNVTSPYEIGEVFDPISYSKAASIIRMMTHFLTNSVFKEALINFLNTKAYQSVQQNDLWDTLTQQAHNESVLPANMTVKEIMDTWTLQPGFPLITVTRNYTDNSTMIIQDRFMTENCTTSACSIKPIWWVPLSYTTEAVKDFNNTKPSYWMEQKKSLIIPDLGASAEQWVIFNIQQTGYYRVNYDERNWFMIVKQLRGPNFADVAILNRAQLIDDALALAWLGELNYWIALDLMAYLASETDLIPWKTALTAIKYFDSMLYGHIGYDRFRRHVIGLLDKVHKKVGFKDSPGDTQLTVSTRLEILHLACNFNQFDCVGNAWFLFQLWTNSDEDKSVSPGLKRIVYCTVIQTGRQLEWDYTWRRYINTKDSFEKDALLNALACTRESWILSRYLLWAVTPGNGIEKRNVLHVVSAIADNPIGQPIVFSFLRNYWITVWEYIDQEEYTMSRIIKTVVKRIRTDYELKDFVAFVEEHSEQLGGAANDTKKFIKQIKTNIKWFWRSYIPIKDWLERNIPPEVY